MKKEIKVFTVAVVAVAFLFAVGMAVAGTKVDDVIKMENTKAYTKHTKGIIMFSHKKHNEEYKLDCGECHHDAKGVALKLKIGDNVQSCFECHTKTGMPDRKAMAALKGADKKKEELTYHYGAIHENCQGCHEKYNKEKAGGDAAKAKKGPAPVSCTQCHPKTAGDK
jgi:hypothetical protein